MFFIYRNNNLILTTNNMMTLPPTLQSAKKAVAVALKKVSRKVGGSRAVGDVCAGEGGKV